MRKSDPIKKSEIAFAAQLNVFKNNIGVYATVVGVTPAQVTAQAADAAYYTYVLQCQDAMQNGAQQWTAWKDILRAGGPPPATGVPAAPTLPTVVPAVAPGIEARFRALVKQIKANASYNVSIGEALGIEGAQQAAPNLALLRPVIEAAVSGNRVNLDWGWQGHAAYLDQCELQVDRADGRGFVLLTYDPTPGFVDTAPFPAAPAKWTYKAIYRVDDAPVGQWSNPVSVTVGG